MKLIKITYDHFIIVDDSPIKENDYYAHYNSKTHKVDVFRADSVFNEGNNPNYVVHREYVTIPYWNKKITHSTKPLEYETVELFEKRWEEEYFDRIKELNISEVKELIGEVDVEKKAENEYPYVLGYHVHDENRRIGEQQDAYKLGYYQALEDNKEKKYTEEDVKKILEWVKTDDYRYYSRTCSGRDLIQMCINLLEPVWNVEFDESGKLKLMQL